MKSFLKIPLQLGTSQCVNVGIYECWYEVMKHRRLLPILIKLAVSPTCHDVKRKMEATHRLPNLTATRKIQTVI